jgi:hypothetical protein
VRGFANFFKKIKKERDSSSHPTTFDNEDLSWMDLDPQGPDTSRECVH